MRNAQLIVAMCICGMLNSGAHRAAHGLKRATVATGHGIAKAGKAVGNTVRCR
jgi:hypothetical protein